MYYLKTLDWLWIYSDWWGDLAYSEEFRYAQEFDSEIDAYNFYKEIFNDTEDKEYGRIDYIEIVKIFSFNSRYD